MTYVSTYVYHTSNDYIIRTHFYLKNRIVVLSDLVMDRMFQQVQYVAHSEETDYQRHKYDKTVHCGHQILQDGYARDSSRFSVNSESLSPPFPAPLILLPFPPNCSLSPTHWGKQSPLTPTSLLH